MSTCRASQLTAVRPRSCHPGLKAVKGMGVSKGYRRPKNVPPILEEAEENTQCGSVPQINLLIVLHCTEMHCTALSLHGAKEGELPEIIRLMCQ